MGIPINDWEKKEKNLDPYLIPYTNSITDQFNIQPRKVKTMKLLEEHEQSLHDFGAGKDFLNETQKLLTMKKKRSV